MSILIDLLQIYSWVIIISALISWTPVPRDNPIVVFLHAVTEPVYAPIRAIIKPEWTGGMDLSPIVVLLLIRMVTGMLMRGY